MKKSMFIHVVVMIVALVAASLLSCKLYKSQREIQPERAKITTMPVGGLHKFAADVEWMLFINYMGSQSTVDESNEDEVIRRLEKLISLDPNLAKVYQEGVSFLSVANPEKTVEMLQEACENPQLKNNATIPFYTGFVMVQFMKPEKAEDVLENHETAAKYFKMATERSEGPAEMRPQYWSYYFRAKAKTLAAEKKIDERLALAEVLYDEYRKERRGNAGEGSADLKNRLFQALRAVKAPSEDYTPSKAAVDRATEMSEKIFGDNHLCGNCLAEHAAGDNFCSSCGTKVQVWGQCGKCTKAIGNAAYCPHCGTQAAKK